MTRSPYSLVTAAVFAVALSLGARAATDSCQVRLSLQLTPDAANTQNPGFLAALVADPQYALRWVKGDDTAAVVDLLGPASDTQCQEGIDRLGRSSHVVNVKVIEPGSTETN
jgi:hypothetical protein